MNDNNLASALRGIVSRGHRDSTMVSALALAAVLTCAAATAQAGNTYVVSTALDPTIKNGVRDDLKASSAAL